MWKIHNDGKQNTYIYYTDTIQFKVVKQKRLKTHTISGDGVTLYMIEI